MPNHHARAQVGGLVGLTFAQAIGAWTDAVLVGVCANVGGGGGLAPDPEHLIQRHDRRRSSSFVAFDRQLLVVVKGRHPNRSMAWGHCPSGTAGRLSASSPDGYSLVVKVPDPDACATSSLLQARPAHLRRGHVQPDARRAQRDHRAQAGAPRVVSPRVAARARARARVTMSDPPVRIGSSLGTNPRHDGASPRGPGCATQSSIAARCNRRVAARPAEACAIP